MVENDYPGTDFELTGKVFTFMRLEENKMVHRFQLEAVINGHVTRLQADGSIPESCLYDRRHTGLEAKRVLETWPPDYLVGCRCGYEVVMKDVNRGYDFVINFQDL